MRSRSSDPAYWRQKAADFRRRALGNPDDSRLVLLCRALEFDGVADELEELMRGDAPPKAPPRVVRPSTATGRARLATVGIGAAFAVGCIIGVAGQRSHIGEPMPSPIAFDVPAEPAAAAPTPQIAAEKPPTPPADERTPESSAAPTLTAERSAEPAAEPVESSEAAPAEESNAPPATALAAAATDVAALEAPKLAAPDEAAAPLADQSSEGRPTAAESSETRGSSPAPGNSETVPARHSSSPLATSSSARPSPRSRSHRKAEPLDLRRELPPPEAPATLIPAPTPTRVAVRSWSGYAGPTAGEADAASQECRPYTASRSATGLDRPVRGLACRRTDGHWQLVTEIPDN